MELAINEVSDITYLCELIPPSCFRKKAGGINSQTLRYNLCRTSCSISYLLIKGGHMKRFLIGLGIVVLIVIVAIAGFAGIYNSIVSKHETITAKWAQVENQLQRRNDLIPNLVNTVKGYAAHEKTVLENITNARSQWGKATTVEEKVKAAGAVDAALARLLLVVENYPNLKADQTFLKLMDELSGTENRIAVERMRYNEAVRDYNITVRSFPGNFVAGMFGYKVATEYFKAEAQARAVPEVKF